jgi:hypothetical protein
MNVAIVIAHLLNLLLDRSAGVRESYMMMIFRVKMSFLEKTD